MVKSEENYGMGYTSKGNLDKTNQKTNLRKPMNVELFEKAANSIVKTVQVKSFGEEVRVLSAKSDSRVEVHKSSKLYKLDPFLDSDGLLRVGGRLGKFRLSHSEAHLLFFRNKATYRKQSYDGAMEMLPMVEEEWIKENGFWILSANVVVRGIIYRCVNCRQLRGKFGVQKMADLPKVRRLEVAPFTHCRVDMFGPCTIRERRSYLKRYCVLFRCFARK